MTNSEYTALLLIVDRSGSMERIAQDMEGGIATLLREQSELPGRLTVDYVRFDDEVEYVLSMADPKTTEIKIHPRSMTALHDAVATAIIKFGAKLDAMPEDERPGKVIVAIITDGLENASKEHTAAQVKAMIEEQTSTYSWQFTYLGANQDAVLVAHQMGIKRDAALTYDPANVAMASSSLSGYVGRTRSSGSASYSDEDRESAGS